MGREGGEDGDRRDHREGRPAGEWFRGAVPPELDGASVSHFIHGHLGASRRMMRRLKVRGSMLVNGRPAVLRDRLRAGDEVVLALPDLPSPNIVPEERPLSILYEDDALIAVDKPAGVLVHPVRGQGEGTLAQAIAFHLEAEGRSPKPRPVHRLDRDTSGVIIFAKDAHAHHRLALQFDRHELTKEYLAVVWGRVAEERGTLSGHLRKVSGRMVVVADGEGKDEGENEARLVVTDFEVAERLAGGATVLRLYPRTGRTHQIRAQLAAAGHKVIGDRLYGPTDPRPGLIGRHALHAMSIGFTHPTTGRPIELVAPLPADMAGLIEELRRP